MSGGAGSVIVIGAGPNGLAAAATLARGGRPVLILERSQRLGGMAAREEFHAGFSSVGVHHDTAGLRPAVAKDLDLERHGLRFVEWEPTLVVPDPGGPPLLLHGETERAASELASISAADAEAWRRWNAQLQRWRRALEPLLSRAPPHLDDASAGGVFRLAGQGLSLRRLGRADLTELLRVGPMCAADWLDECFETPRLKAALAAQAVAGTWMGPWSAGSAAMLIMDRCTRRRSVVGGAAAVSAALAAAARAAGVVIRTRAEVASLAVTSGRVTGVVLGSGETVNADAVLASCDPRHALLDLLGPRDLSPDLADQARAWRCRGTTAKLDLALDGPLRFTGAETEVFERALLVPDDVDGVERAFDAVKYGRWSDTPVLDVYVPSVSDPSLCPPRQRVVSVLVHFAPYDLRVGWDDAAREALRDTVLERLKAFAPSIAGHILGERMLSPADLERRYGVTGGHLHHGEHALDQLLHLRPAPSCAHYATPVPGLFLAGSGNHPGGGVTGAPGWLGAKALLGR